MDVRLKQFGLALCLMISLLIGHASACMCSHHVEKKVVETSDCHSKSEIAKDQTVEAVNDNDSCDTSCICSSEQFSLYVASNPVSKKFMAADETANSALVISDIEFRAATAYVESSTEFANDLSYSNTLKSLLPARASAPVNQ